MPALDPDMEDRGGTEAWALPLWTYNITQGKVGKTLRVRQFQKEGKHCRKGERGLSQRHGRATVTGETENQDWIKDSTKEKFECHKENEMSPLVLSET